MQQKQKVAKCTPHEENIFTFGALYFLPLLMPLWKFRTCAHLFKIVSFLFLVKFLAKTPTNIRNLTGFWLLRHHSKWWRIDRIRWLDHRATVACRRLEGERANVEGLQTRNQQQQPAVAEGRKVSNQDWKFSPNRLEIGGEQRSMSFTNLGSSSSSCCQHQTNHRNQASYLRTSVWRHHQQPPMTCSVRSTTSTRRGRLPTGPCTMPACPVLLTATKVGWSRISGQGQKVNDKRCEANGQRWSGRAKVICQKLRDFCRIIFELVLVSIFYL